jgi:acyl dehydratase
VFGDNSCVPLNQSLVGREYPAPTKYDVSRETIRRFAVAIGDSNPLYHDPEVARAAGHPDVVAPPTFLTVLTHRFHNDGPVEDPELGLDYSVVVHGEQRYTHHRPIVAGDVLSAVQVIDEIRVAGRNELMGFTTHVTDADGKPVAEMYVSMISRGTAPQEAS